MNTNNERLHSDLTDDRRIQLAKDYNKRNHVKINPTNREFVVGDAVALNEAPWIFRRKSLKQVKDESAYGVVVGTTAKFVWVLIDGDVDHVRRKNHNVSLKKHPNNKRHSEPKHDVPTHVPKYQNKHDIITEIESLTAATILITERLSKLRLKLDATE